MDKFLEMKVFATVVDEGSFVGAAGRLEMSKAAVSRYVSELESRLSVRLLNRTTRRLSMTPEGEVFHTRCKALLELLDDAESELTAQVLEARGTIKINVPVTFGNMHLAPLWGAFMERHPQVELDVVLSDRVVDLVDEGFDLAIRIARLPSSTLISRKLAATRMVLCATPQYLRTYGNPQTPADLAQHKVLAYTYLATKDEWEFAGPLGNATVKTRPVMYSNSGDTCRAVALAHQGVILQPTFLIGDDLRTGTLVELMPQYRGLELGIYAVYPSRKHMLPKARLLIDYLADALRVPAWPA
jgi:DNA-binding transcriptional LysR family regulator